MPRPPLVSVVWMVGVSQAAVVSNGIVGVAARAEMAVLVEDGATTGPRRAPRRTSPDISEP